MTQPYDHTPDNARPSDDTPDPMHTVVSQREPEPDRQSFGDERVDQAVGRLAELDERAVGDHVEVFDDIHAQLRDALEEAAVDTPPP